MKYQLFSVDDHVVEHARVWADRLPAKWAETAPHVIEEGGREFWVYDGKRTATMGLNAVVGKDPTEWGAEPVRFTDMRLGCYDPSARAADFDADGIIASVTFPTLPGFGGRVFLEFSDKELADLCVRAYNDFIVEEWCAAAPDVFVPTMIAQLWDPELAAAEIHRGDARGVRAISFPENTCPLGLPSLHQAHWDPVWQALSETGMVVSMHLGASGRMPIPTPDSHFSTAIVGGPGIVGIETLTDLLFSQVVRTYPDLKFVITEGGIGYVPYLLERADFVWEQHRHWAHFDDLRPSDLFHRSFFVCTVNERFGLANRHAVGVENILWELDYPHSETTWPNSQAAVEKQFAGVPDDEVALITHANAQALFRFPGRSSA